MTRAGLGFQRNAFQAGADGVFTAKQDRIYTVETPEGLVRETSTAGYEPAEAVRVVLFRLRQDDEHHHARLDNARSSDRRLTNDANSGLGDAKWSIGALTDIVHSGPD